MSPKANVTQLKYYFCSLNLVHKVPKWNNSLTEIDKMMMILKMFISQIIIQLYKIKTSFISPERLLLLYSYMIIIIIIQSYEIKQVFISPYVLQAVLC